MNNLSSTTLSVDLGAGGPLWTRSLLGHGHSHPLGVPRCLTSHFGGGVCILTSCLPARLFLCWNPDIPPGRPSPSLSVSGKGCAKAER